MDETTKDNFPKDESVAEVMERLKLSIMTPEEILSIGAGIEIGVP